jgi:beta-galactosidase
MGEQMRLPRFFAALLIPAQLLMLGAPTLNANAFAMPLSSPRETLSLDAAWRFHLGSASSPANDFEFGLGTAFAKAGEAVGAVKIDFSDSSWRIVDLPHDWAVEQEFVNVNDDAVKSHGYRPIGRQFPATTVGWYRRSFSIPVTDRNRRLAVKFDGVFRDCIVWLNGHYLGNNLSGYSEFLYDITDYVRFGEKNVFVVRVDASQYEGWFYEGAGIYRHAWLLKYDPLHIPEYGVYVHTAVNGSNAVVTLETQVKNDRDAPAQVVVQTTLLDEQNNPAGSATSDPVSLPRFGSATVTQTVQVSKPLLWSLETPHIYRAVSQIVRGADMVDQRQTQFGIRTILFDKDRGFFLNGKPVKIKGVCCHQDHAGVGSALPDRLQYYRIERLKEMGCNAYRTSHNPPTVELLEACDRLGMLVMDENRLLGSSPEYMKQFETLVLRDRNHPSVIIWSLGNEEWMIQNTDLGKRIALSLMHRLEQLDPTRLCTYAANNGNQFEGINSVLPVRGFNYMTISDIDKYRQEHPDQILIGSEEASTVCTRGIYANDTAKGYVSDYDVNTPSWGATAEKWWSFFATRPWLAGGFVWTGFDYRGEPTPYSWPCINSHFGIMDVCGFPKNNFYYYQAWWTDRDVLHIAPHWNWNAKVDSAIDVRVFSNAETVELFLNGKSLGKKQMKPNSHLSWSVPYQPGTLEARGMKQGRVIVSKVETTGSPQSLRVTADRTVLRADGEDVSVLTIAALDSRGREVPAADNLVTFEVRGEGAIIGVGNGDPSSHEPDKFLSGSYQRHLFNGKCQVIVQGQRVPGTITIQARSTGLESSSAIIRSEKCNLTPAADVF